MIASTNVALGDRVFLVGLRYKHHARHSGYESYGRYVATMLQPPVDFRWTLGKWGWPLNQSITRLTRHPWYSLGAHLTEWGTLLHMARHRNRLYHVLYGDTDLWLLRRANRLNGNHLVASFHEPAGHLRELRVVDRVCRYLDAVILVSETQRAYFEEFVAAERIFVVPHGVDTEFFRPAQTTGAQPHCITVGSHLRDFATLKEAMQLVWQVNPRVRFTAVGTRSDEKSMFPPLQDERVQFVDGIGDDELLQAYRRASVAVFSFEAATANNAILEAMATGLPVVATDTGGIGEYVTPECGILCPPLDSEAMAAAILCILDAPHLQQSLAAGSRQRALKLDFRHVAVRMAEVYTSILATNRPANRLPQPPAPAGLSPKTSRSGGTSVER